MTSPSQDEVNELHLHLKMAVVEQSVTAIGKQVSDTYEKLEEIRELIERMVRVEEKHLTLTAEVSRAFTEIAGQDKEVKKLKAAHDKAVGWISAMMMFGSILSASFLWVMNTELKPLLNLPQELSRQAYIIQEQQQMIVELKRSRVGK